MTSPKYGSESHFRLSDLMREAPQKCIHGLPGRQGRSLTKGRKAMEFARYICSAKPVTHFFPRRSDDIREEVTNVIICTLIYIFSFSFFFFSFFPHNSKILNGFLNYCQSNGDYLPQAECFKYRKTPCSEVSPRHFLGNVSCRNSIWLHLSLRTPPSYPPQAHKSEQNK